MFEKSRNSSYRDSSFREFFLPKLLCDGQGTGEFVRVLETFEFSSIRIIESVLYIEQFHGNGITFAGLN